MKINTFDVAVREAQKARKDKRDQLIKEVVSLFYEGHSCSEIAWILAIPESSVRALAAKGGCK